MIKVIILSILTSCGTLAIVEHPDMETIVDPELQPYVDDFFLSCSFQGVESICKKNYKRIKSIKFQSRKILGTAAGLCEIQNYFDDSHIGIVYINREYFDLLVDLEYAKRSLMTHELSHCLAGMDHITDRPHIMNPTLYIPSSYEDWSVKLNDLFYSIRVKETKAIFKLNIDGSCGVVNEQ